MLHQLNWIMYHQLGCLTFTQQSSQQCVCTVNALGIDPTRDLHLFVFCGEDATTCYSRASRSIWLALDGVVK